MPYLPIYLFSVVDQDERSSSPFLRFETKFVCLVEGNAGGGAKVAHVAHVTHISTHLTHELVDINTGGSGVGVIGSDSNGSIVCDHLGEEVKDWLQKVACVS